MRRMFITRLLPRVRYLAHHTYVCVLDGTVALSAMVFSSGGCMPFDLFSFSFVWGWFPNEGGGVGDLFAGVAPIATQSTGDRPETFESSLFAPGKHARGGPIPQSAGAV